jgi:hypothetical protein
MQPIYIKGDENHLCHFTPKSLEYPKYNYLDQSGNRFFATKTKREFIHL